MFVPPALKEKKTHLDLKEAYLAPHVPGGQMKTLYYIIIVLIKVAFCIFYW